MKTKQEFEDYLVYAWNDYISEVDEAPEDAISIDQIDLYLEGFYQRHSVYIDQYVSLMDEYCRYLIHNNLWHLYHQNM